MPDNKNIFGGYEVFSLVDSNRYSGICEDVIDGLDEKDISNIRKKLEEQKADRISTEELSEEQRQKAKARAEMLARFLRR